MAIWAALIGAVGGGVLNAQGGKAGEKGNKAAQAQIEAAKAEAARNFGPYAAIGDQSVNRLAALAGIEGYRTDAERAYTKHLAMKPSAPGTVDWKDRADKFTKCAPHRQLPKSPYPSSKAYGSATGFGGVSGFGDMSDSSRYAGAVNLSGLGGITDLAFRAGKKGKKKAIAAAEAANAASRAAYERSLASWQAEADRLKAESDASLVGYDPGKAQADFLRSSPVYRFRFDEGVRGVDASGSARGDLLSGAQKKRLAEFGQGLASQEYGSEFSRLMQLAGIGQNAATVKSNVAVGAGSNLAALSVAGGNQQAKRWDNYNDLLQGGIRDYSYLSRRDNNRTSSFDNQSTNRNSRTRELEPEVYSV
ncbi:MAG: hypothetical protein M1608_16600 [Candidatus Omnitrophica bacterium]|nr:hypothetical protein [Candidatus Omnitrophota bacterium]